VEQAVAALDSQRFTVENVHLGSANSRVAEAENAGVKSLCAFVINDHVFHINHGADLLALN
jgi:hypothetical protein